MKIGICGFGFVGNAIHHYMVNNSFIKEVVVYDKYKKINSLDHLLSMDFIYICIPTPYDDVIKKYNMDEIDNTLFLLSEMKYKGIIFVKSTVLPDYCESKNKELSNLYIINNPEFLSAATAVHDFANQEHIIIGYTEISKKVIHIVEEFYKLIFPVALISTTNSTTSSITKLACNSFYATKVQYFTELFLLCQEMNISFNEVKTLMLNNKWINSNHTSVPGSDGQVSFGGACLPKDINALNQFMIVNNTPNKVVNAVIMERNVMRESN